MPKFRYRSSFAAYSDQELNTNPNLNNVDWTRNRLIDVKNPGDQAYSLAPGETLSILSSSKSFGGGVDTQATLSLSPLESNRYRLAYASGTVLAFRTDRNLALAGKNLTIALNANETVSFTSDAGTFSAIQLGDIIFIPGTSTGDTASIFNPLNEGFWQVILTGSATVQVKRPSGIDYTAIAEVVPVISNNQVQGFSNLSTQTQAGDTLSITGSFSTESRKTYQIITVTSKFIEFYDNSSLPASETASTNGAITIYNRAKRYLYIEVDQNATVFLNSGTDNQNKLSPWSAGDPDETAWMELVGDIFSISVLNNSQDTMNLFCFTLENP